MSQGQLGECGLGEGGLYTLSEVTFYNLTFRILFSGNDWDIKPFGSIHKKSASADYSLHLVYDCSKTILNVAKQECCVRCGQFTDIPGSIYSLASS